MKLTIEEDKLEVLLNQTYYRHILHPLMIIYSTDLAIWMADMLYKYKYFKKRNMLDQDGYFFNSQEEIRKTTNLAPSAQIKVVTKLKELGVIETELKGLPRRQFYKFNNAKLADMLYDAEIAYKEKMFNEDIMSIDEDYDQVISRERTSPLDLKDKGFTSKGLGTSPERTIKSKLINNKEIKVNNENIISKEIINTSDEVLPVIESNDPPYNKLDRSRYKTTLQKSPSPEPPKDIAEIIQFWENLSLRKTNKEKRTYPQNISTIKQLLKGNAFDNTPFADEFKGHKFTIDEIKSAILRFSLCALDLNYEPGDVNFKNKLKHYSIKEFIFNPYVTNGDKSWFIKCHRNAPALLSQKIKVKEIPKKNLPHILPIKEIFEDFYYQKVLKGLKVNVSPQDENNFIDGAHRLYKFGYNNSSKMRGIDSRLGLAKIACESILEWAEKTGATISTAKFKADHTYSTLLPNKLLKLGVIESSYDYKYED